MRKWRNMKDYHQRSMFHSLRVFKMGKVRNNFFKVEKRVEITGKLQAVHSYTQLGMFQKQN
jgi:hypothetical protein